MADKHIRIYYGKYIDQIDTEINNDHLIPEDMGDISFKIEPGEPNIPTGNDFEVVLANLDPQGNQRYPYSFWQSQARTEAEGATTDMQIFFKIEVLGNTEFVGMFSEVHYTEHDAKCQLKIDDLGFVLKSETRKMLKAFELKDLYVQKIADHTDVDGWNQLPQLRDHNGNDIPQKSITFVLWSSGSPRVIGPNRVGSFGGRGLTRNSDIWNHLQVPTETVSSRGGTVLRERYDFSALDQTRNTYIQIQDNTIFTRVRFWGITDASDITTVYMTVYHNGQDIDTTNGIIPIGRFFKNSDFDPIAEGDSIDVTLYDYDLGSTPEIILSESDLPAHENMIFGSSFNYSYDGTFIQLATKEYSFFDVIGRTLDAVNSNIADRFASGIFTGTLQITTGASDNAGGSKASWWIDIEGAPYADESVQISIEDVGTTRLTYASQSDTPYQIALALKNSLEANTDINSVFNFTLSDQGGNVYRIKGETKNMTDKYNGKAVDFYAYGLDINYIVVDGKYQIDPISKDSGFVKTEPKTVYSLNSPISGGVDGYDGNTQVEIRIGGQLFSYYTPASGISPATVASDISSIINQVSGASANDYYSATVNADTVTVDSSKGVRESIELVVKDTGIKYTSTDIQSAFEMFDLTKLLDRNRKAFYADPIMFGWIDQELIDVLIGCVWQVSGYLYSLPDGDLAIHSRDYHETLPDDISQGAGQIDFHIPAEDIKPDGQTDYAGGFKTYQIERYADVLGINNLTSKDKIKIYATDEGLVNQPSNKNKKIKTSNYRTSNLGHPQDPDNAPDSVAIIRLSPDDQPRFVGTYSLDDFLPTAEEQGVRFAQSFFYPTITRPVQIKFKDYQTLRVGHYIYTDDKRLWLVKSTSLDPFSLTYRLELEFKKQLYGAAQTNEEGISIGEEFTFYMQQKQINEESISLGEEYTYTIRMKFEEAIQVSDEYGITGLKLLYEEPVSVDEETATTVKNKYEESVSLGEQYSDNQP